MRMIRGAALTAMMTMSAGLSQPVAAMSLDGPGEIEEARRVLVEALAVAGSPDGYAEAAGLYRRAAGLFGDHPEAADAWAAAGRLAYYDGDDNAIRDFDRAGEMALQFGDVGLAAKSFLDAAFVADHFGRARQVGSRVERAFDLAQSPYLGDEERARLMARVTGYHSGFRG